jgi:prepilin-type N-terminal cleavage/methylation domain-containing protein
VARRTTSRGFVLIEVLVAVAVAAVLLVALSRAFVSTWMGISTVREEAETMLIARALIGSVTPRDNATELSQQGSIGRYNWALEVKKAPMAAPAAGAESETPFRWTLYRAGVVVTAPSGRRTSLETSRLSRP